MPNTAPRRLVTPRDIEVLSALDRTPLTAEQLLKLSQTFGQPFTHPRLVRRRLQELNRSGWVRSWPYAATTSRGGSPHYWKLTALGYRVLHGDDVPPPRKRHFLEVGIARHHHTHALADFVIHCEVTAHEHNIALTDFWRENSLCLTVDAERLFPDAAFQCVLPSARKFNFVIELDNSTERIRSPKDIDSWQRKIRLYDRLQDGNPERFRVLVITTRSEERLQHILDAAAQLLRNPNRSLFYGVYLQRFLTADDGIHAPVFRDHRGRSVAMVPQASHLDRIQSTTDNALARNTKARHRWRRPVAASRRESSSPVQLP